MNGNGQTGIRTYEKEKISTGYNVYVFFFFFPKAMYVFALSVDENHESQVVGASA